MYKEKELELIARLSKNVKGREIPINGNNKEEYVAPEVKVVDEPKEEPKKELHRDKCGRFCSCKDVVEEKNEEPTFVLEIPEDEIEPDDFLHTKNVHLYIDKVNPDRISNIQLFGTERETTLAFDVTPDSKSTYLGAFKRNSYIGGDVVLEFCDSKDKLVYMFVVGDRLKVSSITMNLNENPIKYNVVLIQEEYD